MNEEILREFWAKAPEDIREILKEFAKKTLGITTTEEMQSFVKEYYEEFSKYTFIEEEEVRYRYAYGSFMKKYRLTGGGGANVRIKPFYISPVIKQQLKDGSEQLLVRAYGLARKEDADGTPIKYVRFTFWGEDAVTASNELKPDKEYKTTMVWKVDDKQGITLTTGRNAKLILEEANDKQFPSFQEFIQLTLQDTTKVISSLSDLMDFDKAVQLNLYSKNVTDIKVIPNVTVMDVRIVQKDERKLAIIEVFDKSIAFDREQSLIFWADENQIVGRGSIVHLFGVINLDTTLKKPKFTPHFIYPIRLVKYIPEPEMGEIQVADVSNGGDEEKSEEPKPQPETQSIEEKSVSDDLF